MRKADGMITVITQRLLDAGQIDLDAGFSWSGEFVSKVDVLGYIAGGGTGTDTPYGDYGLHPPKGQMPKKYHIARVAWFVLHPDEISGIEVDNVCEGSFVLPMPAIVDGWHRLLAASIVGAERIRIYYGGREDVLRFLTGKRKYLPE